MIISRVALFAHELCPAVDRKIKALHKIIIDKYGNLFSRNRDCIIAVSRVPQSIKDTLPIEEDGLIKNGLKTSLNEFEPCDFICDADTANFALKQMPRKAAYKGKTDFLDLDRHILAKFFDGLRSTVFNFHKQPITKEDDHFNTEIKKLYNAGSPGWMAFNRKRLTFLLQTIHKILDSTDDMEDIHLNMDLQTQILSIKAKNVKTNQWVFGIITGERNKTRVTRTERILFND